MTPREVELLESFVDRLSDDPEFMAWVLTTYERTEGISESDLELRLGLTHVILMQLKLCRRPAPTTQMKDLQAIATFCGVDAAVLGQIINQVDFITASPAGERRAGTSAHHLALAARKRSPTTRPGNTEGV